ncbi:hypothetical protein ABIE59_000549 [Marinobacter sp. MBR-99]
MRTGFGIGSLNPLRQIQPAVSRAVDMNIKISWFY